MPHGVSPIMYPLMVQQETGAPTTPPSSNIGWTLCQQGMCVCDTALARCSNMSRKNPNVPSFPIPILSDHAVVNIGTSLTPLLIRCGQCAQLALK